MSKGECQSAIDLLRDVTDSDELIRKTEQRIAERQIRKHLVIHRMKSNLSQADIAAKIGCSQSKVSKIENGVDDDIRLGDLTSYIEALNLQLQLCIMPRSQTTADMIRYYACRIKRLMEGLCKLAHRDGEIANGVAKFVCHEIPFNLLRYVIEAAKALPSESLDEFGRMLVEDSSDVFGELDETDTLPSCEHTNCATIESGG